VGHNEDPISLVRGTDPRSRKYERPAGVTCTFQVSTHLIECHTDEPSNILSNNPSRPEFLHQSKHFKPEVTVILCAFSLPGNTERLTGESPGQYGRGLCDTCRPDRVICDILNIPPFWHTWPVFLQHPIREVRFFDLSNCFESSPLCSQVNTAYPGKA
jgi:hypothetical protein